MKRKLVVGSAIVLAVLVLVWANLSKLDGSPAGAKKNGQFQGPAGSPVVRVEQIERRDLKQEVLSPGAVEASGVQELRAPFSTRQVKLLVGIGDQVKAGQLLAELSSEELATQVMAQEAQLVRAEASLASLRLQQQQAPLQLAQRVEQARSQLLQAEESLLAASRQSATLLTRLNQAQTTLELLQDRNNGANQVESARQALIKAEEAYRANPLNATLSQAFEQARGTYETALHQSQEAAKQAANELRRAYDELENAEAEYARSGGENSASVQMAKSQVEAARLAVRMAEMEVQSGGNLAQQVRATEADLEAARTSLNQLRKKLAQAQVTAEADGTVLAIGLKDNLPAQEGQVLLTVGDLKALKVTARVDEVDIGKIKPGQPLSIRSTAHPSERFQGEVQRAAAQATVAAQGGAGFYAVEGIVKNSEDLLRAGMNAEVTIFTQERKDVIVVPLAAVREDGAGASVLVVEEFTVKVRPVETGLRTQTEVEILAGLTEGEQVVVSPFTLINTLKDGASVQIDDSRGKVE